MRHFFYFTVFRFNSPFVGVLFLFGVFFVLFCMFCFCSTLGFFYFTILGVFFFFRVFFFIFLGCSFFLFFIFLGCSFFFFMFCFLFFLCVSVSFFQFQFVLSCALFLFCAFLFFLFLYITMSFHRCSCLSTDSVSSLSANSPGLLGKIVKHFLITFSIVWNLVYTF